MDAAEFVFCNPVAIHGVGFERFEDTLEVDCAAEARLQPVTIELFAEAADQTGGCLAVLADAGFFVAVSDDARGFEERDFMLVEMGVVVTVLFAQSQAFEPGSVELGGAGKICGGDPRDFGHEGLRLATAR